MHERVSGRMHAVEKAVLRRQRTRCTNRCGDHRKALVQHPRSVSDASHEPVVHQNVPRARNFFIFFPNSRLGLRGAPNRSARERARCSKSKDRSGPWRWSLQHIPKLCMMVAVSIVRHRLPSRDRAGRTNTDWKEYGKARIASTTL